MPTGATPPEGAPLGAAGGLVARLGLDGGEVRLTVVLVARPVAELRWLFDQVLRKVKKAFELAGPVVFEAPGVPIEIAETLALDLRHGFGERVSHELGAAVDTLAASEALYRAWVEEDATLRTSTAIGSDIAAWGRAQAGRLPVEVRVYDRAAVERMGLRLLTAVGGASDVSPPTLVVARYTPETADGAPEAPLMLLGKGVTFDSGGINVKPYESFVSMMKNDMAGAALAWSLFKHLAEAGSPRPLLLVIPTCENPIGEGAMRPGAVVKSYRGLDVRIDHTDAEGRLILADALAWASDNYQPERVLCFATLTTAALIAYGPYATPVHFAAPDLEAALTRASDASGEDLHFFPSRVWHLEANRDEEADLKNTARLPSHAARGAGSRNAGHFLLHFTDRPLTHFDIFASTWNWAGDAPASGWGATGAPLRTLVKALALLDA
jgi:leucyl aminopeptidase